MCVGGTIREFETAALVLKCTSSNSITCINVLIFVGVGKMNVNPRFSLQVPPPICYRVSTFSFCFTCILSGDVSYKIEDRQRRKSH